MFGTVASVVGGLTAAIAVVLLAEKTAQWIEADAKRRAEREQGAS
jgi:hypothetical protein